MKLDCNGCTQKSKWANKFDWAGVADSGAFCVYRDDGTCIVNAGWTGNVVRVSYSDPTVPSRLITVAEVVPTVRLYLNAQKRRKTLADAPILFVRDV